MFSLMLLENAHSLTWELWEKRIGFHNALGKLRGFRMTFLISRKERPVHPAPVQRGAHDP